MAHADKMQHTQENMQVIWDFIQYNIKVVIHCYQKAFMANVLFLKISLKGFLIFAFLHFLSFMHLLFKSASHSITTGMLHGQKPRYLTAKLSSIKVQPKVQPLVEL